MTFSTMISRLVGVGTLSLVLATNVSRAHDHDHELHEDEHHQEQKSDEGSHQKKRHAEAHAHGVGRVNIVKVNSDIQVEMEFPADDILGFEKLPVAKKSKEKFDRNVARAEKFDRWIDFTPDAKCVLKDQKLVHTVTQDSDHAEVHWKGKFSCSSVTKIATLKFSFFDAFRSVEKIKVKIAWDANQTAADVLKSNPEIVLNR